MLDLMQHGSVAYHVATGIYASLHCGCGSARHAGTLNTHTHTHLSVAAVVTSPSSPIMRRHTAAVVTRYAHTHGPMTHTYEHIHIP